MTDLLLTNLRTIGTHHCDGEVGKEAADEIERLRTELAALRAELEVFREREAATAQGVRWLENESKRIERRAEKAEAERDAMKALAVRWLRKWQSDMDPTPEMLDQTHALIGAALQEAER